MTPVIGITTYGEDDNGSFTLPREYVDSVRRAGGAALLLPPGETALDVIQGRLDGLIIAGGGDIDPSVYGGHHHESVYMVDADRDRMEIRLAQLAIERQVPTLAICRGAQIVAVAQSGTLHEHIPDVFGEELLHRLPPREPTVHEVRVLKDSRLAGILGETSCAAASWHHQALKTVPSTLRIVAHAPDGVVEAFEMSEHHWLFGVQWHPELTADKDPAQQRLFDALIHASREASEKANGGR